MSVRIKLFLLIIMLYGCNPLKAISPLNASSSDRVMRVAKCSKSTQDCYQEASKVCGGSYHIPDNASYPDGLVPDSSPGPVTWFSMNYLCDND